MLSRTEYEIVNDWNNQEVTVSIICITYNHEKYISEAIDSFLSQKTTFPFEVLIGEDCSNDNTLEIINKYQKSYPKIIKVINSKENVGMMNNFVRTIKASASKYIALCEGDDFWTDDIKLQKQVDFMEEHKEYTMCFHNTASYNSDTDTMLESYPNINVEKDFSMDDFISRNPSSTASVLYRNSKINFPKNYANFKLGDWPLHMIHASEGKVKYFPQNMAIYRVFNASNWSKNDEVSRLKDTISMLEEMNLYFDNIYYEMFKESILSYKYIMYKSYMRTFQDKEAKLLDLETFKKYNVYLKSLMPTRLLMRYKTRKIRYKLKNIFKF